MNRSPRKSDRGWPRNRRIAVSIGIGRAGVEDAGAVRVAEARVAGMREAGFAVAPHAAVAIAVAGALGVGPLAVIQPMQAAIVPARRQVAESEGANRLTQEMRIAVISLSNKHAIKVGHTLDTLNIHH